MTVKEGEWSYDTQTDTALDLVDGRMSERTAQTEHTGAFR